MEIVQVYQCYSCHYEIEVTIRQSYTCPACGGRMGFVTSRPRGGRGHMRWLRFLVQSSTC